MPFDLMVTSLTHLKYAFRFNDNILNASEIRLSI